MVVVSMNYYGFCIYFSITICDCKDIMNYLDCAEHIVLVVMFVVVAFCSLDDSMFGIYNDASVCNCGCS